MGIDYSADVTYQRVLPGFQIVPVPPTEVLSAFLASGWAGNPDGSVHYVIFETDDDPDHHYRPAGEFRLAVDECLRALERGCRVGLLLLWPGTEYGGTLYLGRDGNPAVGQLLFSADREWRKRHPDLDLYIDYNWYTLRIVTPLRNLGLGAGISWNEH